LTERPVTAEKCRGLETGGAFEHTYPMSAPGTLGMT
jgi:hypothetical protein